MPITPYHFGPSGFFGLVFRRWLDLPVLLLANVIVDVEVLVIGWMDLGWPRHRYLHTLFWGALAGAAWGAAAYTIKPLFEDLMRIVRLEYKTSILKMIVSGVLGCWLHVFVDAFYHYDVRLFWPNRKLSMVTVVRGWFGNPKPRLIQGYVEGICAVLFVAAVVLYIVILFRSFRKKRDPKPERQ